MSDKQTVCEEGDEVVSGERAKAYGPVGPSLRRIAKIWSAILDVEVPPQKVALCLSGLKIARECVSHKRDNLVDGCGYARVLEMFYEEEAQNWDKEVAEHNAAPLQGLPFKKERDEAEEKANQGLKEEPLIRYEPHLEHDERSRMLIAADKLLRTSKK